MTTTKEQWIEMARRAGQVARESAFDTGTGVRLRRVDFPAVLRRVLAPRMDGTLTAARRAWSCALRGE